MAEKAYTSTRNKILEATSKAPETESILKYLMQRRAVPEVVATPMRNEGEFQASSSKDSIVPASGQIRLHPMTNENTYLHELVHAADGQIVDQYYEDSKKQRGPGNQFTAAYNRLRFNPSFDRKNRNNFEDGVSRLAPNLANEQGNYRSLSGEIRAFAVADSVFPNQKFATRSGEKEIPAHLNATVATEFMILLDLASREEAKKAAKVVTPTVTPTGR